jgi:hypothetical protein
MSTGAERSPGRVPWVPLAVAAFAVAQAVVFVRLGTWYSLREWARPVVFPVRRATAGLFEPTVGARIEPVTLHDCRGQEVRVPQPGKVTTVAFVGQCTECWAWVLRECRDFSKNHPDAAVYAAVRASPRELHNITERYRLDGILLSEGATARARFNVWFEPRIYVFDKRGRLAYLQRPEDPSQYVRREVRRVVAAAGGGGE